MQDTNNKELLANDAIIQKGLENKLISFNEDNSKITYFTKINKTYKYTDPEEKVRAITFIKLILDYKYNINDIALEVKVPRRTPEDLADIVVYEKDSDKQPYLVVECKKDDIKPNQFTQAIEQVFGNANSLGAKYAWVVAGNTETAFDVANFNSMERDKNVISEIPIAYGKAPKYRFKKTKDKNNKNSLKIISREELISTLEKCHQTVWQGGKLNPSDAFDEVSKILFCKLKDEKSTVLNEEYKFQIGTHESISDVSNRVYELYQEGKKHDPNVFFEDIKLDESIIYKTVEHLQGIDINGTDLDSKGIAFEKFMGDFFKGKMGQYFTPRNIVYFCVQMLDVNEYHRVLDPACGSGGFLLHAMDLVRSKAEKNFDTEVEIFNHWHDFASKRLFGIEINDQIARVCKMNMIIHDDGHSNVISTDALDSIDKHIGTEGKFEKESFDIILTNPPFGAKVLSSEKKYLNRYILGMNGNKVRVSQSTEVLFIERCYEYLKDNGKMAIVLPDGILTNTTLQYVRDFIMEHFRIDAIVSIPQTAFSHYGAGVKCSLLFLTKEKVSYDYDIFMASAEDVGYDATGKSTGKNDLEEILIEYKNFIEKKNFKSVGSLYFLIKKSLLINKRIDPNYHLNSYTLSEKYAITTLKDCSFNNGTYGANEIAIDCNEPNDIRYIRITDIDEYGNLKNDTIKTVKNVNEKYILNDNDFLFARSGSVGKTLLYKENMGKAIYAGYLIKYILDTSKILPEYLFAYCQTDKYWKWIKQHERPAVQSNINSEEYSSMQFPLPPMEVQEKIANIMQDAYKQKEKLENEADEILSSINDYVLKELDIKIEEKQNKEKCFTIKASEIKNKRMDPFYHKNNNKIKSKFDLISLNSCIDFCESGSRPKGGVANINNGIFSFGGEHIKDNGVVTMTPQKYIPEEFNNKILKTTLKLNDVLIVKDGATTGKIGIIENIECENQNINEHLFLLRANKTLNQKYLFIILSSQVFQKIIKSKITGATVMGIIKDEILNINIPLPPIEVQNEIAQNVFKKREIAFQKQRQAKSIIQNAKKQIEDILFV